MVIGLEVIARLRRNRWCPYGENLCEAAKVERVLLAFDGFGGVEVTAKVVGNGEVSLLDAGEHFAVKRLLKGFSGLECRVGVGVFGLQVPDDCGVFFFAEPGVVVDAEVAVEELLDGLAGRDRRLRRGVGAKGDGVFLKVVDVHFPFC